MLNKIETAEVVIYSRNGFEDDAKFVEVDGQKFEADPTDPTKAKVGDDGKPVPFKAAGGGDDDKNKGGDKKTLEDLAKDNPELQKLLDEKKKLEDDKKKADDAAAKAAEEAAEKNGEWKNLAESRKQEADDLKKQLEQKEEILGKYVNSTKTILKEVMATIPEEKRGLIPENFSPREKLEYISKNAKVLGAKVSGSAGGVSPNDGDVAPTEEAKIQAEIDAIRKKEVKTQADHTKIFELSKKIKEVRAANQGK